MSAFQLTCPICDAVLRLEAAPTAGAHSKCPRCGTPFSLDAPASSPPPAIEARPPPRDGGSAIREKSVRAAAPKRDRPDDLPARSRPAGDQNAAGLSPLLMIGGGAVGGVAVLALIIGLFIWGLNRGANPKNPGPQASRTDDPAPRPLADDRPKEPPPPDPPKDSKPAPVIVPPVSVPPVDKDPKPPVVPIPAGDSALSAEVLRRVKAATLFVKVDVDAERGATGSGFFEQSTGLILTNAHVVGMLREGAPPPRKVEVVVNSGLEGEITLPAQLVSVDHDADLALLRVQLSSAQTDAFPRLTVAPAKDLLETQSVYVAGFPFGEKVGRNVTISSTSVSSLRRDADGALAKVQVNGGMHPGNSGGPVIDGRGNVVGVAVSGIPGTQINFAIPGEKVQAFIEGRLAEIHVATDVVQRDGKLIVPVQIMAIDPRKRITRIALDYWTGPERPAPIPPSDRPPTLGNLTTPRQTAEVAYDAERSQGRAELVLDALPARGMQLWVQPVVTNGGGEAAWLSGTSYNLAPPVDEKPATLTPRHRVGKRTALLTSTARFQLESHSGNEQSFVQNLMARVVEQTQSINGDGARVRLAIEKFEVGVKIDGARVETSERFQTAVRRDFAALAIELRVDPKGNLTSKKNDVSKVPQPSREILQAIGDQIQQSFDIAAVPQPGDVKPGQTWQAKRELPLDMPDSFQTALLNVTYTYRGLRELDGRTVAVLELRGVLVGDRGNETLAAKMTGTALIDQQTGVVVQAKSVTDAALTIRVRDESLYATGTLEVVLTRDLDGK